MTAIETLAYTERFAETFIISDHSDSIRITNTTSDLKSMNLRYKNYYNIQNILTMLNFEMLLRITKNRKIVTTSSLIR